MSVLPIEQSALSGLVTAAQEGNELTGRQKDAYGVYGEVPMCTPKYMRHRVGRHREFEDTTARMILQVPVSKLDALMNDLSDSVTRQIANVMATDTTVGGYGYFDFIMSEADHSFNEKVQIAETLADNYVAFFFGHSPPVFTYAGKLINTYQDDWTMRMFRLFRDLGRGTQLARRQIIMHLRYDSMLVSGCMINFRWGIQGGFEHANDFSFGFLVKRIEIVLGGGAPPSDLFDFLRDEAQQEAMAEVLLATATLPDLGILSGATQTYAGSPSGVDGPAGVSPNNQGNDSTGAGTATTPTAGGLTSLPQ